MNNNMNNSAEKVKKARRKFNVIDVLVILLVATVIGVSIYTVFAWSNIKSLWSKNVVELQYAVEFRGVDKEFIDNIKENDQVIDAVSKSSLGTVFSPPVIEKHSVLDYEEKTIENPDKTTTLTYNGVLSEYPDKYDITVYITTTAEYQDDIGYTVNGRRIAVGEMIPIRFPDFAATAYCIEGDFKNPGDN